MAETDLPDIHIAFKANIEQLQTALKTVQTDLKKFEGETKHATEAAKGMGVGTLAAGTAIGQGISAVATKMFDFGKETVQAFFDVAKETRQLQRVLGGTAEDMSGLLAVGERFGISADTLTRGFRQMAVHVMKNDDAIKRFGIAYRDARGQLLPTSTIVQNLSDKFKAMPNGLAKTAMAQQLFGRNASALLPLLNQGSEGLKRFTEEAAKAGLVMSQQDLNAAKDFQMQMKTLQENIKGAQVSIGRALLPTLAKLVEWVQKRGVPMLKAFVDGLTGKNGLAKSASTAEKHAHSLGKMIIGLFETIWKLRGLIITVGAIMVGMWAVEKVMAAGSTIIKIVKGVALAYKTLTAASEAAEVAEAAATGGVSLGAAALGATAAIAAIGGMTIAINHATSGLLDFKDTASDITMPDLSMPTMDTSGWDTGAAPGEAANPIAKYIQTISDAISTQDAKFAEAKSRMANMTIEQQRATVNEFLATNKALLAKARQEEVVTRGTKNHHAAVEALNKAIREQASLQNELNRVNKDAADLQARQVALATTARDLSYLAFKSRAESLTFVHESSVTVPVTIDGREVFRAVQKQSLLNNRRNTQNGLALSGSVV